MPRVTANTRKGRSIFSLLSSGTPRSTRGASPLRLGLNQTGERVRCVLAGNTRREGSAVTEAEREREEDAVELLLSQPEILAWLGPDDASDDDEPPQAA
jgi:hypothetical protein